KRALNHARLICCTHAKARVAALIGAFSISCRGKNPALLLRGLVYTVESRVLILNHDPVFEDRLLSFFDTEEGVEIRVVRSVSEAVLVLMAENFDGFIVEGPPSAAIEAATMGRQHFPSLTILCVPWQRPRGELFEDADRQQILVADGTGSAKRLRREVMQFVRSLEHRRSVPEEGIDPC